MDRPILFSTPMVRALLAGTKTQTRRLAGVPMIEQQPNGYWHIRNRHGGVVNAVDGQQGQIAADYLPIQPGDRLWVRETWRPVHSGDPSMGAEYRADHPDDWRDDTKWKPGIHMFRWASRLTLHVTGVRVQRLQEISREDALAEGIELDDRDGWYRVPGLPSLGQAAPQSAYGELWDSINGTGSWDANPWVAAYTFTVEHANIDHAKAPA
jgi:hypothetical protein